MSIFASNLIATLGGSTAVSRLTAAPVSTVHSWKQNGIPSSRLAHLRLIAEKEAIAVDWETGLPGRAAPSSSVDDAATPPQLSATKFEKIIRSSDDRDQEGGHGSPFGHPSLPTSSPTIARPQSSPVSPASLAGKADAA